jgi:hypothetical protein
MHGLERIADWVGVAGAVGRAWNGMVGGVGEGSPFWGTCKLFIIIALDEAWLVSIDSNGVISLLECALT